MDIKAKKSLGQNFLVNQGILGKIIAAANLTSNDTVIEVGPGKGALTELLSQRAGTVIAIEKDRRLIEHLTLGVGSHANVRIIEGDVLEWRPPFTEGKYKVVANLPYYITSFFLRTLFEVWPRPDVAVLMVQKEVAQRIMAHVPHMNLLALSVQAYATPDIITHVSRGSFRPVPAVDSAVIRLTPRTGIDMNATRRVLAVAKAGFHAPRKQLINNLTSELDVSREKIEQIFQDLGIMPKVRPENLSLTQWEHLSGLLAPSLQS